MILLEVLCDFGAVGGGGVVAPHRRLGQRETRGHLRVEEGGGGEGGEGALGAAVPEDGAVLLRGARHCAHAPVQLAATPLHLQPVQQDVQRLQPHSRRRPHLARIRLARVETTLRPDTHKIFFLQLFQQIYAEKLADARLGANLGIILFFKCDMSLISAADLQFWDSHLNSGNSVSNCTLASCTTLRFSSMINAFSCRRQKIKIISVPRAGEFFQKRYLLRAEVEAEEQRRLLVHLRVFPVVALCRRSTNNYVDKKKRSRAAGQAL